MPIIDGFITLFTTPHALLFAVLGSVMGILVGAIPGLTGSAAIAMILPATFYMPPLGALAFVYTISKSSDFGGSIPAILFNTPGTPSAAATQIDGYPLTQQGKQGKALKMAVIASAMGDCFSELLLIFGAVHIASYTEKMGPPEYFAVYCCAFIIIGSVMGKSIIKGILSTLFGLLAVTIGIDPITAASRFDFGTTQLSGGLTLVPVLLGLFVFSEVLVQAVAVLATRGKLMLAKKSDNPEDNRVTWPEFKRSLPVMCRSTGLGVFIGMMPGIGAAVACFVGYAENKRRSKTPEIWGKGAIEGVAACEAANNAVSGANLIPLLSLGVPGSTSAVLLMGVFLIHNISIGPMVFTKSGDILYGLFASGLLCIFLYFIIGYFGSGVVGRIIGYVPPRFVYPFIFITTFVASYAGRSSLFDVLTMCVFGSIGFLMKKAQFSPPAFIIAFMLGLNAESSLRQSLLMSDGGWLVFFQRPMAMVFFAIGLSVLFFRSLRAFKNKSQQNKEVRI